MEGLTMGAPLHAQLPWRMHRDSCCCCRICVVACVSAWDGEKGGGRKNTSVISCSWRAEGNREEDGKNRRQRCGRCGWRRRSGLERMGTRNKNVNEWAEKMKRAGESAEGSELIVRSLADGPRSKASGRPEASQNECYGSRDCGHMAMGSALPTAPSPLCWSAASMKARIWAASLVKSSGATEFSWKRGERSC